MLWVEIEAVEYEEGRIRLGDEGEKILESPRIEGRIRLSDSSHDGEEDTFIGHKWIRQILLSWHACLSATLTASLSVLLWRYCVNRKGRTLMVEAGFGALFLAADR